MAMKLERGSGQPMYLQLQSYLRNAIVNGTWKPGEAIPAEKALAQEFAIARMTVRQAIDGLIHEGLLVRILGHGTYVARPRVERQLGRMRGFSEDMRARGMAPASRMLCREIVPAPEAVSIELQLGIREAVIHIRRLRLANRAPMALEECYLNYTILHGVMDADLESGSLYAYMRDTLQVQLRYAEQELEATHPTQAEAERLEISRRHSVLVVHQTTFVQDGGADRPGIMGRTVYRADRYRFRQEVRR
jgi:GntR family transcriptional regulator